MTTSKSVEQLAEGVYRAMKRTKARKSNALRTTRYANAINDLLQREQPRRDFVGDLLRVCAGLQECEADLGEIRDEINYALDAIENKLPEAFDLDAACINEEQNEGPHEVAQIRLMVDRSAPAAIDYLAKRRRYIESTEPVARAAQAILGGAA
jgi:hypothetical protein